MANPTAYLPLVVIGRGGHARVIADTARACGQSVAVFLDDDFAAAPSGLHVEGPVRALIPKYIGTHRFAVGIGDHRFRRAFAELVLAQDGELATMIHPSAIIASDVTIGAGSVVLAGAIIGTGARIGRFTIVNTGASVDHDCTLEDNVQIGPGATLAGTVVCRRDAFVCSGATVIPKIEIGAGAIVAAGATVIKNVTAQTMVAGCPAMEKKTLRAHAD